MGTEQEQGEIQKSWQIRVLDAGDDSVKPYGAFGPVTGRRKDVMSQMSVKPKFWQSHDNCMYDTFVMDGFNEESSNGFQFKLKDGDEDAAFEAVVSVLDKAYLNAPYSVDSDGVDGLLGAAYWAARSQTSGGTFVSQPEPARNGIHHAPRRHRDRHHRWPGPHAGPQRPRPDQRGHHGGVINQTLLETVSACWSACAPLPVAVQGQAGQQHPGPQLLHLHGARQGQRLPRLRELARRGTPQRLLGRPLGVEMDGRMIQGTENFPSGLATIDAMLFVNHANLKLHTVRASGARPSSGRRVPTT